MLKNGLLPIVLPSDQCSALFNDSEEGLELEIDLEKQEVRSPRRNPITFTIEEFPRHCLLNGLDDIGLTLQKVDLISGFETKRSDNWPWLDGFGYERRVPVKVTEPKGGKMDW